MIKPKLMSVCVGAIASILIATPAIVAQTQTPPGSSGQLNDTQVSPTNPLSKLNLSPPQVAQIKQIEALIQAQVQSVLAPDQWQKLQSLQTSGADQGSALAQLNLSPKQVSQLKEIEAIAQQRLLSILNSEQQKQLQEGQLSAPPSPPSPSTVAPSTPTTPSAIPSAPVPAAAPTNPAAAAPTVPSAPTTNPPATAPAESSTVPPTLAALNLSADQQAQITQIQTLAKAQVQSFLKPEQWQQLQSMQSAGTPEASALEQLNLSGQQKSQLQEVQALAQQQILSILTNEQKKTLLQQR